MANKAKRVARMTSESWIFICMDGPDTAPLREKNLFGHLDHIEAHNDFYRVAGPMRSGNGSDIIGSFFIVDADSEEAAWDKMRGDPYISSNMFATITVHHFTPACGEWLGGVIWDQDEIRANLTKYAKG